MSQEKLNNMFFKAVDKNDLYTAAKLLKEGYWSIWSGNSYNLNINIRDKKGRNAAMRAVIKSQHQTALWLMTQGIDIQATDKNGDGLLHHATIAGHYDLTRDLIDVARLKVNQTNRAGRTALHLVARNAVNVQILSLLLDRGAEIDKTDNAGKTALHEAVYNGNMAVVRLLLERGANPNLQDNEGNTALTCALFDHRSTQYTSYPTMEICKALLAAGADAEIANNKGEKPAKQNYFNKYFPEVKAGTAAAKEVKPVLLSIADKTADSLRIAFENEGLDPDQDEQWRPIGQSVIEHIIGSSESPRILVTTFNFVSRQCTTASKNLLTGQTGTPSVLPMDQFNNTDYVSDAHQRLLDAGKTPPALWPNGAPKTTIKKKLGENL